MNIGLDMDGVIMEYADIPKEQRCLEEYQKVPIIAAAVIGIFELHKHHDIYVISARQYPHAFAHMKSILRPFPIVEMVCGIPTSEKWRVLQALDIDVHVDDNVRALEKLPSNIMGILFTNPINQDSLWPNRVNSWSELIEMINVL